MIIHDRLIYIKEAILINFTSCIVFCTAQLFLSSCGGADKTNPQQIEENNVEFVNPQRVTIHDYTGDAMEHS